MFYLSIILTIISIIILYIGLKKYKTASIIQNNKLKEITAAEKLLKQKQEDINNLSLQRIKLLEDITKEKERINTLYENEKNRISEEIKIYKDNLNYASEQYVYTLEKRYEKVEKEYSAKVNFLNTQEKKYKDELETLKNTLSAGVQAQLREREKEENLQFYKLSLTPLELEDVIKLNTIKLTLNQPVILSKLIWTQYFQKQTTEMCNRILGTKIICGIYKITNLKTQQCYIGQSVDVAQRWKDHVKCGLGIEASATNKLYKSMQEHGVWSFSFELMEECSRNQLNEKEKFWIELYQSDKFGFNSTKGNK
jgi:hypothetical protein